MSNADGNPLSKAKRRRSEKATKKSHRFLDPDRASILRDRDGQLISTYVPYSALPHAQRAATMRAEREERLRNAKSNEALWQKEIEMWTDPVSEFEEEYQSPPMLATLADFDVARCFEPAENTFATDVQIQRILTEFLDKPVGDAARDIVLMRSVAVEEALAGFCALPPDDVAPTVLGYALELVCELATLRQNQSSGRT